MAGVVLAVHRAAAPARLMPMLLIVAVDHALLLLLATVVVAAAEAGRTARRCACWDALAQAWEALLGAAFSVAFVRFCRVRGASPLVFSKEPGSGRERNKLLDGGALPPSRQGGGPILASSFSSTPLT